MMRSDSGKGRKILFFCSASYVAGLEIVTLHLIRGLQEKNYDVSCIINGWNNGDFKKRLQEMNVPYYEIKLGWLYIRKPLWTMDTLIHFPQAFFSCKKIINELKPDILHFTNYVNFIMLYPLIGTNTVFTEHNTDPPTAKNKFIFRTLDKKVKYFVGISDHIVKVLQDLPVSAYKICLVNNGIPQAETPAHQPDNTDVLNFAIIGQVGEWKGHGTLINAVKQLVQQGLDNFKILIYGDDTNPYAGQLKKELEKNKINNNFVWKGFVKDQDEIYKDCAVVVVPSLFEEPFSLTTLEAMSRGKAVIVSDKGGLVELIQHEQNGLVFTSDNPAALAECMKAFLQNRNKIRELGNAAKKKASDRYSYTRMTEEYIEIYNKVINNPV